MLRNTRVKRGLGANPKGEAPHGGMRGSLVPLGGNNDGSGRPSPRLNSKRRLREADRTVAAAGHFAACLEDRAAANPAHASGQHGKQGWLTQAVRGTVRSLQPIWRSYCHGKQEGESHAE